MSTTAPDFSGRALLQHIADQGRQEAATDQADDLVTVSIPLRVTVSRADWQLIYGVDTSRRKALVDDVRSYVLGQVQDSAAAQEGGIREVTIR